MGSVIQTHFKLFPPPFSFLEDCLSSWLCPAPTFQECQPRSPVLVLIVQKQIPCFSANDKTVTGPQQRLNTYLRSGISCLPNYHPCSITDGGIRGFFFLLQMFSYFCLIFSIFCAFRVSRAGQSKQSLASMSELNTWWLSNYRALTQAWGRIPI